MRDRVAPLDRLDAKVVEIAKWTRRQEGVLEILNLTLDLALGLSRQLRVMVRLRNEFSASPIHFAR